MNLRRLGRSGPVLLNFVLFHLAWLGCVLGGARDRPSWAWVATLVTVAAHLALQKRRARAAGRLAVVAGVGLLGELLLVALGALSFAGESLLFGIPIWIVLLWLGFATTFEGCLGWLRPRPLVALGMGLVGSPLSYSSAAALGALSFGESKAWSLTATGVVWAISLLATTQLSAAMDEDTLQSQGDS